MNISTSRKTVLADEVVETLLNNLNISDLFEDDDIFAYVMENMWSDMIQWAEKNCEPDDVFGYRDLSVWAEKNGYVEEER